MSLQPRNTKIMRREGPWGRAGWFRSRYLTLTDATAGRLERSCRHPPPLYSRPPHLPQARVDGGSGRPATGSPPPGVSRETSVYLPEARWRWGEGVGRQESEVGMGSPEGALALRCGCARERPTELAIVLV